MSPPDVPAPRISDLARSRGPGGLEPSAAPDYLSGLNPEQQIGAHSELQSRAVISYAVFCLKKKKKKKRKSTESSLNQE
jgi:hypothetical protein